MPSHRPPLVAPQQLSSTQPPRLPLVRPPSVAPPLEEASQRAPSEGPLVPPHRPPSVAPHQLSSRLESSAYEPSADPSTSSQPPSEEYKPICMKNYNSIWKDHKNKIKSKYFKPRSEDPNLKDDAPDASSGHRAFRESAEDKNPYTAPPEDQLRDLWEKTGLKLGSRIRS
ncbi:probable pathogenesis-related protein ARB_02861 [Camellia sinensis]|uniref:probable pathogenesis-related protein ARB_02861 n=1 Tax=Camellia sinensis TaxID=4442 RepID=UPI001036E68D|nr:probable pathogenesis-related protein ARB_02861 [Camellia sinensis]